MSIFNQAQGRAMNALARLTNYKINWRSVKYEAEDLRQQPMYVPYTKVNAAGDVVKIYPDGSVYVIPEVQWLQFATKIELPLE